MKYYVVDAFADEVFQGNPAGVVLAPADLSPAAMQAIAAENNLAETAFVHQVEGGYGLRWFTPAAEVDLCGHATLASAFVLSRFVDSAATVFRFFTVSGELSASRDGQRYILDFPARPPQPVPVTPAMAEALGVPVLEAHLARDLLLVVDTERRVRDLRPVIAQVATLAEFGVVVTAPGERVDFVSRFFAPNVGVAEDPVTGSSHTELAPYWAARLGRSRLVARQVSRRGGGLTCVLAGDRVMIAGSAQLYLSGDILV